MNATYRTISLVLALFLTVVAAANAQPVEEPQKRAQTGFKFITVMSDARSTAMADAMTSLEAKSTAMLYNPSSMARLGDQGKIADVFVGQTNWIADINYMQGAAAFSPAQGSYGVFGVFFQYVDYGDMYRTVRANNEAGYLDMGTFSPYGAAIGVGYGIALSEKFSIGGNVKYLVQNLGTNHFVETSGNGEYEKKGFSAETFGVDFGVLYKTGFKSVKLGIAVKNFSPEVKYIEESFELPLTFELGMSVNAFDFVESIDPTMHSMTVAVNALHPRDFDEYVNFGLEYTFMNVLSLRGGYATMQDERGLSAGGGLKYELAGVDFGVDYSYAPFGVFSDVHRISTHFGL